MNQINAMFSIHIINFALLLCLESRNIVTEYFLSEFARLLHILSDFSRVIISSSRLGIIYSPNARFEIPITAPPTDW